MTGQGTAHGPLLRRPHAQHDVPGAVTCSKARSSCKSAFCGRFRDCDSKGGGTGEKAIISNRHVVCREEKGKKSGSSSFLVSLYERGRFLLIFFFLLSLVCARLSASSLFLLAFHVSGEGCSFSPSSFLVLYISTERSPSLNLSLTALKMALSFLFSMTLFNALLPLPLVLSSFAEAPRTARQLPRTL